LWNGINTAANNYVIGETQTIQLETGTSYQIGLNAAAVSDRAKSQGASSLEAGYEGTGYLLGSFTGFTPEYEGFSSYDIAGAYQITNPYDKYSRIGFGTLGIVGTGFGLENFGSSLMSVRPPSPGLPARFPADLFRYAQHSTSQVLGAGVEDGTYVFVQDVRGVVHIAQNGPHMHPQVLGNATAVASAGEITIQNGVVVEINNLSGTFKPAAATLNGVQQAIQSQGLTVAPGAIQPFVWPSN